MGGREDVPLSHGASVLVGTIRISSSAPHAWVGVGRTDGTEACAYDVPGEHTTTRPFRFLERVLAIPARTLTLSAQRPGISGRHTNDRFWSCSSWVWVIRDRQVDRRYPETIYLLPVLFMILRGERERDVDSFPLVFLKRQ